MKIDEAINRRRSRNAGAGSAGGRVQQGQRGGYDDSTFDSPWLIPGINERLIELHARDGSAQLSMSMLAAKLNEEFDLTSPAIPSSGAATGLNLPARPTPIIPRKKPGPKPMRIIVKVDAPIVHEIAIEPPPKRELQA